MEPARDGVAAALDVATVFPAVDGDGVTLPDVVPEGFVGVNDVKLDDSKLDDAFADKEDGIDVAGGNDKDVDALPMKQNCCAKDSAVPTSCLQDDSVQLTRDFTKCELTRKHQDRSNPGSLSQ